MKKFHPHFMSVVVSTIVSFFFVAANVYGASTISTDISTDGNLTVSGTSVLTGGVTMSSTATVSSTLSVSSLATLTGGFISKASSTVSSTLNVDGPFGVATSTPAQELSVSGDGYLSSTATTTLEISSSGSGVGGCIQLRSTNGSGNGPMYRMYITGGATSTLTGGLVVERGTCQ